MIEVFKTSVTSKQHAEILVAALHKLFPDYTVNFDLEDCDNILRVRSSNEYVDADNVICFLKGFCFQAEVLPDLPVESKEFEMMMRCVMQN